MFCTSLRWRPSLATVIPKLVGAENLGLRETQLGTHDLAIQISTTVDPKTGRSYIARQLRVLLLSPSDLDADKLHATVERIRHFASLTGGQDIAIVFLLNAPKANSYTTAKELTESVTATSSGEDGIFAYTKLQATMVDHTDIPHVPILQLANLESLPELLTKHVAALRRPKRTPKPSTTPFALLQLCTANPPMSQHTAFILSDLFSNLRELAAACTAVSLAPNSSSPSAWAAGFSQGTDTQGSGLREMGDEAVSKLKRLRDMVGDQECQDIVDFWKEEWAVD